MTEILEKVRLFITSPQKFFESIKQESAITSVAVLSITVLISQIILLFFPNSNALLGGIFGVSSNVFSIASIVMSVVSSLMATSFLSLILAGLIFLFKGKSDLLGTFKVVAYSSVPVAILSLIPVVGSMIGFVYAIILMVMGIKVLNELSYPKAIVVVVLPLVIIPALIIFYLSTQVLSPSALMPNR